MLRSVFCKSAFEQGLQAEAGFIALPHMPQLYAFVQFSDMRGVTRSRVRPAAITACAIHVKSFMPIVAG